jgi:RNA polymerase sigma-70 factor (ECF subfamily)
VSDDAALVARTLAGDQSAYAGLVERYQGEVFHLALRYTRVREDAEDLAQEAFLRAFRALASYDPGRPFGAWLYAITARLCIDHHRRRKVRPVSLTRPEEGTAAEEREWEIADPSEGPEALLVHRDEAARLSALIDRLSPDYRLAILLRHAEDLSYEEIAEATGVPLGTVKARIHRARNQLRAWIEGTETPPGGGLERGISPASQRTNPKSRRGMHPDPPVSRREDR